MSDGRYKAYPEYKDSGMEWLGFVPSTWSISRIAFVFTQSNAGEVIDKSYWGDGSEILYTCNRTPLASDYRRFPENKRTLANDLLLTRNGTPYVHKPVVGAIYSNVVQRISLKEQFDRDYLNYCLGNSATNLTGYGVSIESLNFESWKSLVFAYPSLPGQIQIAKFLDHETAKIDRLIEKQAELIRLLKEKRQAVISHAVTKGLNPHAPLKDSGIPWLGQIPAHWDVLKGNWIGRLFGSEVITDSDIRDEGDIPFIKVSTLSNEGFELGTCDFFLTKLRARQLSPKSGYVVFPKRGAAIFMNKVNIVKIDSIIDPNLMGWEIGPRALPEFVAYLLKLRGLKDIADVSTVPQINNKHIEPIKFPIPPRDEQARIIDYLATETDRFGNLISNAENAIELIQERRTALISAAVTGKIDLRHWQPPVARSELETSTADAVIHS